MFGQNSNADKLMLSGDVLEYFSEKAMPGVSIKATNNGTYASSVIADGRGKYKLLLDFEKEYLVIFEKAGFISKKIIISTKGVPPDERDRIADLLLQMTLFKKEKDLNVSFLDQPIGKAQYMSQSKEIDWNMSYTAPITQKLNGILTKFKAQKRAQEEAEQQKKKEYAEAMKTADKAFFKKDYETAKVAYQKALSIDPTKPEPKDRLDLMEKAINGSRS